MTIAIHLGSQLMSEAIQQLLARSGYDTVVVSERFPTKGFNPDVLLVDITTLRQDLLAQYPEAKVLLINTGIEPDKLCATLLSFRIHGVLSTHTELHLFKKALTAINEGQIWIDNGTVKALLHDSGNISQKGRISPHHEKGTGDHRLHLPGAEQQGDCHDPFSFRTYGEVHLNTIFKKFNVTSRSKLVSLAMSSRH